MRTHSLPAPNYCEHSVKTILPCKLIRKSHYFTTFIVELGQFYGRSFDVLHGRNVIPHVNTAYVSSKRMIFLKYTMFYLLAKHQLCSD